MKALKVSILGFMFCACLWSCDQNDSDEVFNEIESELVTGNTEEEEIPTKEGPINYRNITEEEDHPRKED